VIATFDDANPFATAADFSVTSVSYTGAPSFLSGPSYAVQAAGVSGGASHWQVVVSGTIAEAATYTATVNVADADGSTVGTSNTAIAVADAALTDTTPAGSRGAAVEGAPFSGLVLATF